MEFMTNESKTSEQKTGSRREERLELARADSGVLRERSSGEEQGYGAGLMASHR